MIDLTLLIGSVGAITGVISLIWHISKSKSKLKLESAYFHHSGKADDSSSYSQDLIQIKIILRNLGHRSTIIDGLSIIYGCSQTPETFKEITIPAGTSKTLSYELWFNKGELKNFSENSKIKVGLDINHTFGHIHRKANITLGNEYHNF